MTANSADSDDDSSRIRGIIEAGAVTLETWDLGAESFFLNLLFVTGIMSSEKNNKLYC